MRCGYCDVSYDVIGKMETFTEDVSFILEAKNLTSLIPSEVVTSQRSNYRERKGDDGKNHIQAKRIHKYFKTLPLELKLGLREFYRWDFELFGYDSKAYI